MGSGLEVERVGQREEFVGIAPLFLSHERKRNQDFFCGTHGPVVRRWCLLAKYLLQHVLANYFAKGSAFSPHKKV